MNDKGRMTLETLDRETSIPYLHIDRGDARAVALLTGLGLIVGFLGGKLVGVDLLAVLGIVFGFSSGILILIVKPRFLTGVAFFRTVMEHLRLADHLVDGSEDADESVDVDDESPVPDQIEKTESTREHTHIERYHPYAGVVERDDGEIVAGLEIAPQSMDFAEGSTWRAIGEHLEHFANRFLTFDIQVVVPTEGFPMEDHIDTLEQRVNHPDVDQSPGMQAVLEDHVDERREQVENATISTSSYYIIVTADRNDEAAELEETGGSGALQNIPVLGSLFRVVSARNESLEPSERLEQKLSNLEQKLTIIERDWVRSLEGATSQRLETPELLAVMKHGISGEYHSPEEITVRTQSVTGERAVKHPSEIDAITEPGLEAIHQGQLTPAGIERQWNMVEVDGTYRQTMHVEALPDEIQWGAFRQLFTRPDLEFNFSMHLKPLVRHDAKEQARDRIQSLNTEAKVEEEEIDMKDRLDDADRTELLRQGIKEGQRPFEVSIYVTVSGDTESAVTEQARKIRSVLKDAPANMVPKVPKGKDQLRALESTIPVGKDVLGEFGHFDPTSIVLGRGVGAMLASMKDNSLLEQGGIELGEHAFNGTPVIKDQFETETNYNWTIIADSGSGKSYFAKKTAIDTWLQRDDTKIVFIDPLRNFEGVAHATGAEKIRVGGGQTLNPLEIKPVTSYDDDDNVDPLTEKIKDVLSFFDNYAAHQGITRGIGEARTLLSAAVTEAYHRKDITHDISTHSNESPTVMDVIDILGEMSDSPEDWVLRSDNEEDDIETYARQLLNLLRPFEHGEYEHLAQQSDFSLGSDDMVYLDLNQSEGSEDGGGGLMMQLVFSQVYEAAKTAAENVIIYIDEARYFMRNSKNLEFLGQRVRHGRHYNTSIRFITQNINDFFSHEEAESIVNNSAFKAFLRTREIDAWQDTFDLNDREVSYIRDAETGTNGYSHALIDIDGRRYPLQVSASSLKHKVIDFDIEDDDLSALPGFGDDVRPVVRELLSTMEKEAAQYRQELTPDERETYLAAWNSLPAEARPYAGLLTETELYHLLQGIAASSDDPEVVLAEAVQQKIERLFGEGVLETQRIGAMFSEDSRPPEELVAASSPPPTALEAGDTDEDDADEETDRDTLVGLSDSAVIGEDDFESTVVDDEQEPAEEETDHATLTVPENRREVFAQALVIDRRDIPEKEKADQIEEVIRRAYAAHIEVDSTKIRRAIKLDRGAERKGLQLTLQQLIHAVDQELEVSDLDSVAVSDPELWDDLPEQDSPEGPSEGATLIDSAFVENGENGQKT